MTRNTESPELIARGTTANLGRTTGYAQVIDPIQCDSSSSTHTLSESIDSGAIVVTPDVEPQMVASLRDAGGFIISDEVVVSGRGSVVARQFEVPAIVNCPYITNRLTTGDMITVDGKAGSVYRWESTDAAK